ncbi:MAG: SDR family oxidoreductase [Flavobacteriaceae bacterium]|nr:SDR family oxidoreductase [Bacteroidia bacterium]NNK87905.1 SDR family oxidoreductase [Flavobacteriaceae bacterium]
MKLKGKIAVITGGSRGLGRNTALHLADAGSDIIFTYYRNEAAADSTVADITEKGQKAFALQLDTRKIEDFHTFKDKLRNCLKENFGRDSFDFLVNNAGFGREGMITDVTEEDFDDLLNVHFKGVFFLTQKLLDSISDGGRIINVSSGLARFSIPGYAAYACMKGAVEVFTRYLAKELGPRKITVNTLAPGAVNTDFNKENFEAMPKVVEFIASQTALGRVGESDDIGGAITSLCLDEMAWVNGQRIEASGGMFT